MNRRISHLRIAPVKLQLPSELMSARLTLLAYGNLTSLNQKPHIWCLFCDARKQLYEVLQPLSLMTYFRLGSLFNHGHLINNPTAQKLYSFRVSRDKISFKPLPDRLLQKNLSQFSGNYQAQQCIPVRNKQIQLPDLILRTLCPDPEFVEIVLTPLSQSFILRHVYKSENHIYAEIDDTFSFQITAAIARQLAWLAGSEEYRAWQRSIAIYAGEALSSTDGMPWRCPLPKFDLKVSYSAMSLTEHSPVYRIASSIPVISTPFSKITVFAKGKSQTFQL